MSIPHRYPRAFLALLLALVLLAPALALAPAARADDPCVVTNGADDGPGSLRVAVENTAANGGCPDGGTVTFAAGVTEVGLGHFLRIGRALTIQGPGVDALVLRYTGAASVSGNVVTITGGPAILRDLTITGGSTTGAFHGAGVRIAPSAANHVDVTLERVRVAANTAEQSGGGVYASNATLQITDSTIETNQAGQEGGGIYLSDQIGPVAVTLTGSTVRSNRAGTYSAGGITIADTNSDAAQTETLTVRSSAISGNTGRGIANTGSGGPTTVLTDSTISDNTGTGISMTFRDVALINTTLSGNGGGAAAIAFGLLSLTNSTVSHNTNGALGAIFGKLALLHTTVVGNTSPSGGAVDLETTASASIRASIVAGNMVGQTARDCTSTKPTDVVSQGDNLVGSGTGCPSDGTGDIVLTGALATVLDPTLADNGGPQPLPHTPTHNLVPGSAAIDHIDSCTVTNDQRGEQRPKDGDGDGVAKCDIGAVEYTPAPPSPSPSPSPSSSPSAGPCGTRFGDVPASDPACVAIEGLAGRGVINGCDSSATPPLFCPNDPTLRHQMAALIVRAIPAWAAETGLPNFSDNTDDTELMTRVGTLQRHNVVRGYQDEVCVAQGKTPPCYGPLDTVRYGQVLLFIARALVADNIWTLQPDDRTIFPDQNGAPGADPNADQQTLDHRMVVTYVHYVGAPPDVAAVHAPFQVGGVAHGGWGDDSTRAWFTRAFWPAIRDH